MSNVLSQRIAGAAAEVQRLAEACDAASRGITLGDALLALNAPLRFAIGNLRQTQRDGLATLAGVLVVSAGRLRDAAGQLAALDPAQPSTQAIYERQRRAAETAVRVANEALADVGLAANLSAFYRDVIAKTAAEVVDLFERGVAQLPALTGGVGLLLLGVAAVWFLASRR